MDGVRGRRGGRGRGAGTALEARSEEIVWTLPEGGAPPSFRDRAAAERVRRRLERAYGRDAVSGAARGTDGPIFIQFSSRNLAEVALRAVREILEIEGTPACRVVGVVEESGD